MNKSATDVLRQLGKAYAWVLFVDHPFAGWLFLAATFWHFNIGASGLLAGLCALIVLRTLRLPMASSELPVFNAVLVGLSLGAFYTINGTLLAIIFISSVFTVLLTVIMADRFWRYGAMPVLSLPFVIVAFTLAFAAKSYAHLVPFLSLKLPNELWLTPWLDQFFSALGAVFFLPHPVVGIILFVGVLWRSRYLALLAVCGYAVGLFSFEILAGSHISDTAAWNGFNFSLTAMALGGIYMAPGRASFFLAMFATSITAVITTAMQNFLILYQLPVMALPFLTTTLIVLAAFNRRVSIQAPFLVLDKPSMPETNYERIRAASFRVGEPASTPLLLPVFGEWQIYQGFNGAHTHIAPWQYALDFFKLEDGQAFRDRGAALEDYFCYGLPVLSPAYGTISRIKQDLADNIPGEVDTRNNWGNFVLIRLDNGYYALLAHLQQDSVQVKEGDIVTPGTIIARCGNSGRSPQPHLHCQVQTHAGLGADTALFHLTNVIVSNDDVCNEFQLVARPQLGARVHNAQADNALVNAMHLPVGKMLSFTLQKNAGATSQRTLKVELSLLGEFLLRSDLGAQTHFVEINSVLAFFGRNERRDEFLDLFVLALGVTPLSVQAERWRDAPNVRLLPLSLLQRIGVNMLRPLGGGLNSQYHREWNNETHQWFQHGEHRLDLGIVKIEARTLAILDHELGCRELHLYVGKRHWRAELIHAGLTEDAGIPGWRFDIKTETHRD